MNGSKIQPVEDVVAKTVTPDFDENFGMRNTSLLPIVIRTFGLPGDRRMNASSKFNDLVGFFKISSKFFPLKHIA
jgi:hypothetical protein